MGKPQTITARKLERIAREGEIQGLTARQWEVQRRLALGQDLESIAADLGIAKSTAHHHSKAALRRHRVGSRMELWRALGWLKVPPYQHPMVTIASLDWRDSR